MNDRTEVFEYLLHQLDHDISELDRCRLTKRRLRADVTSGEIDQIGGTNHPVFSPLGVMSAKNTAVNILILTTFLSFLIYWRGSL